MLHFSLLIARLIKEHQPQEPEVEQPISLPNISFAMFGPIGLCTMVLEVLVTVLCWRWCRARSLARRPTHSSGENLEYSNNQVPNSYNRAPVPDDV